MSVGIKSINVPEPIFTLGPAGSSDEVLNAKLDELYLAGFAICPGSLTFGDGVWRAQFTKKVTP